MGIAKSAGKLKFAKEWKRGGKVKKILSGEPWGEKNTMLQMSRLTFVPVSD